MDSNTGANDMKCKKCDRLQAEVDELWRYRKRAEKAERERDQARASAYNWEATAGEWEKRALAAESRPLTADDISDEMVERARNAPSFDGRLSPTPRLVREMLTAALTEPPARPDGAEQFDAIVDSAIRGHSDITDPAVVRAISNALAEEMNR